MGVGGAGRCPTVGARIISPASIKIAPTPDDHLAAGPHCRVKVSCSRRVGGVCGCPTVGAGIISPARVGHVLPSAAPDDHFAAGPHCRVSPSASGRVAGAGGGPTVGAGIIPPAGVKRAVTVNVGASAPDDHFAAGPHCRVVHAASGRVGRARWSPCVVDATTRREQVIRVTRYYWKRVVGAHCRHCHRHLRFRLGDAGLQWLFLPRDSR